jgi:cytochrome P450
MAAPPRPSVLDQARWAIRLQRDPVDTLTRLHQECGPLVDVGYRPFRFVFGFGPEVNEALLTAPAEQLRWREALSTLIPIDGETALVVTDGEAHDRRRRIVQRAFSTRAVHGHVRAMVEEVDRVIRSWPDGSEVDLYPAMRDAVRRIVVRVLFGDRLRAQADELGALLEPMLEFVNRPPIAQLKLPVPGTLWRRANQAKAQADKIIFDEIAFRRAHPDTGESSDVLGLLVSAQEEGGGLSDLEIRDQVVSLIAAGYDTTSAAAAWLAHQLLADPAVWNAARDEAVTIVGDDELTDDHLGQMRYTDGVVNEVLRLRPPGVVSGRYVAEPFDVLGVTIPAGRTVLYSPYVTQRMPELWPDPDQFRPERWDKSRPDYQEPAPYSFVPFGGAYRRCIGFGLAMLELKVICAELVRHCQLTLVDPGRPLRPVGIAAMHPAGGVRVRVDRVSVGAS